jgi:hypothetical protein
MNDLTSGDCADAHLLSRQELLKRAGAGGAALALPALLGASGALAGVDRRDGRAEAEVARRFGVEIPQVSIRFGMSAFGDHNISSIGIINGWFKDVGISIGPGKFGYRSLSPQVITRFVTNQVDIHTWYGPLQIEIMDTVPQVKLFTFSDTYVGTYMLAPPKSGAKTVSQLVKNGVPFRSAIRQVMGQMRGKRVAIDNTGSHRIFLDAIFKLAGMNINKDTTLSVVADAQIVLLGRGGKIDFCSPAGAAQNVQLIQEGWYPVVAVEDLIRGLPRGDFRGVGSIGHTGYATTDAYFSKNEDTILRMAGVMFRIIDAIHADIKNKTDRALKLEVPVLEAAAGVKIGVEGLRTIFTTLDPLKSFEQQGREYWLDRRNPFNYWNVYSPQIKAAQRGGLLPKNKTFTPDDAIIAPKVYRTLLSYRRRYDQQKAKAAGLQGDRASLARQAATHYRNRNYLDAFRFLDAAIKG